MHPCIITLSASSLYLLALSLFSVPSVRLYLSLCVYLCVSLCLSLTLCLFVCMYCPVFCVHFSGDGCHAPLIIPHILLLFSPLYISYPPLPSPPAWSFCFSFRTLSSLSTLPPFGVGVIAWNRPKICDAAIGDDLHPII